MAARVWEVAGLAGAGGLLLQARPQGGAQSGAWLRAGRHPFHQGNRHSRGRDLLSTTACPKDTLSPPG